MDKQSAAMQRLLADARQGGQAKVDALIALTQRTIFVVPWPNPADGYRTLMNSGGMAALPIFTSREMLSVAAERFGWVGADGVAPTAEVGARQALLFARDRDLAFVVVDIAGDHSLEIARPELDPLLTPAARRESQGPFAGAGRISTSLMQSMQAGGGRPTPPPGSIPAAGPMRAPTPPPGSLPPVRPQVQTPPPGSSPGSVRAESSSPSQPRFPQVPAVEGPPSPILAAQRLLPVAVAPDPALLDALEMVLRGYPEVEWACVGLAGTGATVLGLKVDPRMRGRVDALATEVGRWSRGLPIVLLDDPQIMRAARSEAYVFFPWRKKPAGA